MAVKNTSIIIWCFRFCMLFTLNQSQFSRSIACFALMGIERTDIILRTRSLGRFRARLQHEVGLVFATQRDEQNEMHETPIPQQQQGRQEVSTTVDENSYTSIPRLHVSSPLSTNGVVELTREQAHYVTKVMRMGGNTKKKSQNHVRLFDGRNGEWLATLEQKEQASPDKKRRNSRDVSIVARCTMQLRPQPEHKSQPWLICAPIKMKRFKFLLEKCTELGAGRFLMAETEFTDKKATRACLQQIDKLHVQLVEASEQCERLTVPQLSCMLPENNLPPNKDNAQELASIPTFLEQWQMCNPSLGDSNRTLFICRERSDNVDAALPILTALKQTSSSEVAFLIGPEGGWSPQEERLFDEITSCCSNIQGVSLGPLILRAETAAITAMAASSLNEDASTT